MKFECLHCGLEKKKKEKKTSRTDANKFCDNACQGKYQLLNITIPRFYLGEVHSRTTLKKILIHLFGNKCVDCGNVGMHNGKELRLQLDHKDGNASNDSPDNVRLLCPNCHSQTPTFTAKNKGNGCGSRNMSRS